MQIEKFVERYSSALPHLLQLRVEVMCGITRTPQRGKIRRTKSSKDDGRLEFRSAAHSSAYPSRPA